MGSEVVWRNFGGMGSWVGLKPAQPKGRFRPKRIFRRSTLTCIVRPMQTTHHSRLVMFTLSGMLVAAALALVVLYPRATRSLVQPHQQQLVDRAERGAAALLGDPDDQRRITFPIVMELSDRTCVELRSTAADGGGNYLACYSRSGELLEERASVGF